MSKLFQLQKRYSDRLHLKLTGGHSKYFVNLPMSAVTTSSVPPFPISKLPIPTSKAMKQARFTAI
ncbi:hypothetical protein H6F44_00640 [Pseudanabaena sp. FACHB-1277]|uniref:Uncharacterized protein n=1 Tax=Pseudanabaena cinerea FACHB-1277 TaxID=2949581 RepID=A0A926Z4K1_9CYAN|nr:hypothetical protein [Pseudanabaena cinerea]MBD2148642.1 hypothetical protein [Pseudanabaena cinerea FACHB-1277]